MHKAQVTACVRVPDGAVAARDLAEFATTSRACWRWRTGCESPSRLVAMEATGVYWKPVWAILEDDFELMLVNARHVKQVALV